MAEELLLDGLKVLDVASWIAAPVAGTMLADLGADVIKVELPEVGDGYRHFAGLPTTPASEQNYTWHLDARNRRSLSLNLKSQAGMDILHRLIKQCDVYITNQPLGLRRKLGLQYEDLAPINPRMIYASLTAWGEEGPDRDNEGFDLVAYWARSGLMDLMREDDAPPCPALPGMGDHPTAVTMYANIMTALLRRERTGKGAHVFTSLLSNGLWSASCIAQAKFSRADFSPYRHENVGTYPHTAYEAADGRWVTLTMLRTEEDVDQLLLLLDATELLADERFGSSEQRLMNAKAFVQALAPFMKAKSSEDIVEGGKSMGLQIVRVAQLDDLPTDPQVLANPMLRPVPEEVSPYPVVDSPLNIQGMARAQVTKPPELGEHTDEILAELGFQSSEIAVLRSDGVV